MSIRSTIAYVRIWWGPEAYLHVFRSVHDERVYVTVNDVQLWPPSRAMNRKTGKIGRWRYDRFQYHDPKPIKVCNCWRCSLAAKSGGVIT